MVIASGAVRVAPVATSAKSSARVARVAVAALVRRPSPADASKALDVIRVALKQQAAGGRK